MPAGRRIPAMAREPGTVVCLSRGASGRFAALVARGLTNRQIAEQLVLSERTAEGHLERIRGKVGFTSRAQIAVWAAQQERAEVPSPA